MLIHMKKKHLRTVNAAIHEIDKTQDPFEHFRSITTTPEQKKLQQLIDEGHAYGNFAKDLASKELKSDKQRYWVDKLIREAEDRKAAKAVPPVASFDLTQIHELFEIAKAVLTRPKVRLALNETTRLTLSLPSEESKNAGGIYLKTQEQLGLDTGYDSPIYIGKVTKDGALSFKQEVPAHITTSVTNLLNEFAANPAATASKYGKLTSACSFCGRTLTDARSVEVGYGKECSEKWRLPWG